VLLAGRAGRQALADSADVHGRVALVGAAVAVDGAGRAGRAAAHAAAEAEVIGAGIAAARGEVGAAVAVVRGMTAKGREGQYQAQADATHDSASRSIPYRGTSLPVNSR